MNTDSFYQGIRLGAIIRLINYNIAGYSEYTPILFISFDSVVQLQVAWVLISKHGSIGRDIICSFHNMNSRAYKSSSPRKSKMSALRFSSPLSF